MPEQIPYYFFEYDRPPGPTGRARKPGISAWRMTIEHAAEKYPGYRPVLHTVEYRPKWDGVHRDFQPYKPGTGPRHWGKGNLDGHGNPIK